MPHSPASCRPWSTLELKQLRVNGHLGAQAVAALLHRSVISVKAAASRAGISLRRPGERRGLVLGQPRSCSLRRDLREDLVSGTIDAEVVASRLRIDAEAQLCPMCGRREVVVPRTSLCRVCHLRRLTEAHLLAIEERDCQRALWASRQCLKRTRDQYVVAE